MSKSSWNTGKRVVEDTSSAVDSAVKSAVETGSQVASQVAETGGSIWQTVVDGAAEALATGGEYVSDIASSFVDDVPEMVENVKERYSGTASNLVSTGTSTPAQLLVQDVVMFDFLKGSIPIQESSFTEEEVNYLREIVKRKGVGKLTKKDYGSVSVGGVRGGGEGEFTKGLSIADRLYNSLGDAMIRKDPDTGEYYIEDQYDWNMYVDYTEGETNPETGRKKGKVYKTEEFEENLNPVKELYKTLTSDASAFEKAHNIAFLLGSRDYVDDTKDKGRKVRINLGKV